MVAERESLIRGVDVEVRHPDLPEWQTAASLRPLGRLLEGDMTVDLAGRVMMSVPDRYGDRDANRGFILPADMGLRETAATAPNVLSDSVYLGS